MKEKATKFEVRIGKADKMFPVLFLFIFLFMYMAIKQNIFILGGVYFYMVIIEWILLSLVKNIKIFEKILIFRAETTKRLYANKYKFVRFLLTFIFTYVIQIFDNIWINIIIVIVFGIAHSIACNYVKVIKIADE